MFCTTSIAEVVAGSCTEGSMHNICTCSNAGVVYSACQAALDEPQYTGHQISKPFVIVLMGL